MSERLQGHRTKLSANKMTCDGRCSSRRKQPVFSSFSRTVYVYSLQELFALRTLTLHQDRSRPSGHGLTTFSATKIFLYSLPFWSHSPASRYDSTSALHGRTTFQKPTTTLYTIHFERHLKTFSCTIYINSKGVCRILVRGVNAPLPLEAKKILKIWLRNGAF